MCIYVHRHTHKHTQRQTQTDIDTQTDRDTQTHLDCICISLSRILNFFSKDVRGACGFKESLPGPSKALHKPKFQIVRSIYT